MVKLNQGLIKIQNKKILLIRDLQLGKEFEAEEAGESLTSTTTSTPTPS